MLARVQSFILQGIDASPCEIEIDVDETGMSKETVVGLPTAAVKESIERVRSAITNTGYRFPAGKLLVNLAPADVRKDGPVYDLPMAIGLLVADGAVRASPPRKHAGARTGAHLRSDSAQLDAGVATLDAPEAWVDHRRFLFAGELALDGRLRPIRGAIALAFLARQRGMQGVILPAENAPEAAVVTDVEVLGARTLAEVVGLLNGEIEPTPLPPVDIAALIQSTTAEVDFGEVRGQEAVKRAITVAAAGGHNLIRL